MAKHKVTLSDGTPIVLEVKRSLGVGIFTAGLFKRVVVTVKIKKHNGRKRRANRIELSSQRGTDGAVESKQCTDCRKEKIKWREFGVPQAARITVGARALINVDGNTRVLTTHIGDSTLLGPDFI